MNRDVLGRRGRLSQVAAHVITRAHPRRGDPARNRDHSDTLAWQLALLGTTLVHPLGQSGTHAQRR